MELPIEAELGAVRFSLPTVLKPRYTPAGSSDPLAGIGGGGSDVERGTGPAIGGFSMEVIGTNGVNSVTSPTHSINVKEKEGSTEVTLTENGPLVKDIVLLVSYKEPNTPRATVEEGIEGGNELLSNPAIMLDFFPKFDIPRAASEFIFIIDRSGSMRGEFIKSAKQMLLLFLKSIPLGCYFNIMGFGSTFVHLYKQSVVYNQTNLNKAIDHVKKIDANLGGTEMLSPLRFVFNTKLVPGYARQVFILTDGSVANTVDCIEEVKKNSHSARYCNLNSCTKDKLFLYARVFTFGIGSGASTALVKGLAKAGNGCAEFIEEGERMEPKVSSMSTLLLLTQIVINTGY